jgi:glycosyltransferase involved in cell wall biosynthesis
MIKKPIILFLLHLPPPVHGSSMVGLFVKDNKFLNSDFACTFINLLASKDVAATGLFRFSKLTGFIKTFFRLFGILVFQRPSLCYFALTTTGAAFYRDFVLVLLLKTFRVKLIYHLHNKGILHFQDRFINRICYQITFKDAEVILLSQYLYDDVKAFVPLAKVHICPNGIDTGQNCKSNSEITGSDNSNKYPNILFLSNLIASKGVWILLEALAQLKDKGINFTCTLIGGEGDISLKQLESKIEEHALSPRVKFIGKKHGLEKNTAFSQADIFTLPTFYPKECFPLVLLEAMSYSLPIVTTYEGGIPDIVDDGISGYLVPQNDATLLSEKLEVLIQDQNLRIKMGKAANEKYCNQFTLEKFDLKIHEIINKTLQIITD